MPPTALLIAADVEAALVRPLTDAEDKFVNDLIDQASVKLRMRMPSVDARMAAYQSGVDGGLHPKAVASVLADVIARRLLNPKRIWSTGGESAGPYSSPSETYPGARGGSSAEAFGNLVITDADLAQLNASTSTFVTPGTIHARARFGQ